MVSFHGLDANVVVPGKIDGEVYTYESEAIKYPHLSTIEADWGMHGALLPEVCDWLLNFSDTAGEVVLLTPCYKTL